MKQIDCDSPIIKAFYNLISISLSHNSGGLRDNLRIIPLYDGFDDRRFPRPFLAKFNELNWELSI